MKNLITLLTVFVFGILMSFSQVHTCDCKSDLDFIIEKIKKMPSYKKQIKGDKLDAFNKTYDEVSAKMKHPIPVEDCYKLLLRQIILVNDAHVSLGFSNSDELKRTHPKTDKNINQLKTELESRSNMDLEGIYIYNKNQKIGVYFADNKKDLIGAVLESEDPIWKPGDIHFYATPTNSNKYDFYYYNGKTKTPGFVRSLSFENGRIWSYKKEGNTNNFELPITTENATFKEIDTNIQYLSFKNFSNSNKKFFQKFYKETKDKITAKNIIVDLRSNAGGNSKFSDVFLKDLKDRNVFVITNCFTGSNGEQFTLKLLKNKNTVHLGQTTRGIIAYGKNYGYNYDTPSGNFNFTPTDMNFHKFIDYEGKGISPQVPLDFNRDWMEQTIEIIENYNKGL